MLSSSKSSMVSRQVKNKLCGSLDSCFMTCRERNGGRITNVVWVKFLLPFVGIVVASMALAVVSVRRELYDGVRISTVSVIDFKPMMTGVELVSKPSKATIL